MVIKVLIADDHSIVRDGLNALLSEEHDIEVVAQAKDGQEAIELFKKNRPDIVLMDSVMPIFDGAAATARIKAINPGVKVIGLSAHIEINSVVDMFNAGAIAYIHKDCGVDEIIRAINTVIGGNIFLSSNVLNILMSDYLDYKNDRVSSNKPKLTPRETEVLKKLAEGKNNKEIAALLNISVKTVQTFVQQIVKKVGIDNIAGLTRYAINEGLAEL
jgi:DNA-binding NarL/FixJ family response regulator